MQARFGVTQASWNCMRSAAVKQDPCKALLIFRQMQREGVPLDARAFVLALQACCNIADSPDVTPPTVDVSRVGMTLHSDARRKGLSSHAFVGSALVNLYGKCGDAPAAENAFAQIKEYDEVAWTSLIGVYVELNHSKKAFHVFKLMLESGIAPNERTFSVMIQACCILAGQEDRNFKDGRALSLQIACALHEDALRSGCANLHVKSALVTVYGICDNFAEAESIFCEMYTRDVVAWNAMLSAYVMSEEAEKALLLYSKMQKDVTVRPNNRTYVAACQACCILAEKEQLTFVEGLIVKKVSLRIGRALHADAKIHGMLSDTFVSSTLVKLYGKCGNILEAETVFDALLYSSTAVWNALLSAYADGDQGEKALHLYERMLKKGGSPNGITFKCILSVCSDTGCLQMCLQTHCSLVSGGTMDTSLATTLIHGYGNCASMEDAKATFFLLYNPDTVSWNALGAGHSREGSFIASMQAFDEMQQGDVKPDDVSFLSLMSVCNHAGLVFVGMMYWAQAYSMFLNCKFLASVVDLLGRAGDFARIESMCLRWQMQLDLAALLCLLRACQAHGNVSLGKWVFNQVLLLQRTEASAYVLMYNIYADAALSVEICEGIEG